MDEITRHDVLTAPGLLRCYTNPADDAQPSLRLAGGGELLRALRQPGHLPPVFECRNTGAVATRYISAVENLWNAGDTLTVEDFIARDPGYLG